VVVWRLINPLIMNDSELYNLCKKYGSNALLWRRKFLGLLPEVYKRRLHEKKGFVSVFEFAAKLAGVSQEQVKRVLSLDKKFEKTPNLHAMLINGEVSVNKLARVASIATGENDEELAAQVKFLPNRAVEVFVRDFKSENGLNKPQTEADFVHVHKFEVGGEAAEKLKELEAKGFDVNELLLELLKKRDQEIRAEKAEIAENLPQEQGRYTPVKTQKVIAKEYGTICAEPKCNKPSKVIHHTARFGMAKQHNPFFMAPLCEEHHLIAHSIDVKIHEKRREALLQNSEFMKP